MLNICNFVYISIQITYPNSYFLQNLEKNTFVMTFSYICALSGYKGTFHWYHTGKEKQQRNKKMWKENTHVDEIKVYFWFHDV